MIRNAEKQKTAANLSLAAAPAAKLCALGHHGAQIAARQLESAERQPRLAAGSWGGGLTSLTNVQVVTEPGNNRTMLLTDQADDLQKRRKGSAGQVK